MVTIHKKKEPEEREKKMVVELKKNQSSKFPSARPHMRRRKKGMTRVGFEPTPSYDDQEAVKLGIKVDLNLTPWTNSAILPWMKNVSYFVLY